MNWNRNGILIGRRHFFLPLIFVMSIGLLLLALNPSALCGEKEELQYQNAILRIQNVHLQLQIVVKERDQIVEQMKKEGYTFDQNGNYTRPKAEEPKKK